MLKLSTKQPHTLILAAQGLDRLPGVLAMIQRMGALQIDTINIVARSPYLVLWSRLGSYEQGWLDELWICKTHVLIAGGDEGRVRVERVQ